MHLHSEDEPFLNSQALIWSGGQMTNREYFNQINALTIRLRKMGLKKGDRVAIVSEIHFHFPLFLFAILKAGGIVVSISPKSPQSEIDQLINSVNCVWTITINCSIKPADQDLKNYYLSDEIYSQIKINKSAHTYPDPSYNNDATIIFTSGSQGKAKGVLHTISNHVYSAMGSNANIILMPGDRWLVRLPFYHIAAIAILFRCALTGACCVLPEKNLSDMEAIKKYKITHMSMVPVQLQRLIVSNQPFEKPVTLKSILLGGDKIPQSLLDKAKALNLPVYCSYGSTEMCSQITTTSSEQMPDNAPGAGKVLPYRELKIEPGGHILVRGRTLCRGYIKGNKVQKITDDNGWFHTGDLGYFDKNNNLIIQGRADNRFISGGENIYPEEIESALLNEDNVIDACVVEIPDKEFGAKPVAFIKLAGEGEINHNQLYTNLQKRLPRFKIPVKFLPLPEKSGGIKYSRSELRQIALES